MKGKLTIIKASGGITSTDITEGPGLDTLQKIVGGNIELIAGFETYNGERVGAAYCHDEGKLNGLRVNYVATEAWEKALGYDPGDLLVGDVAIITGDDELLETL